MNRDAALAALAAADIPQSSAESQLFIVERVLEKLGTSIEQHADLLRNSTTLEVRVDYLAAVFGHYAVAAAYVLVNAVTSQPRPVPPARFEGNDVVTNAVPCTVQHALDDFDARHLYERDAILATYGLSSYHLAPVRYRAIEIDTSGERRGKEQP